MIFWWLTLAIKLALAAWVPISADEAYYWIWGQHLQLSYFDHPPMVAWLFSLSKTLPFHLWTARWPAVVLGHGSLLVWYWALKDHLPNFDRRLWWMLLLLSPLTGPGSLIVTPDLPLIFFWGLSLGIWLHSRKSESISLARLTSLGLAMGLGFLSKYTMVILGLLITLDQIFILRHSPLRILRNILVIAITGAFTSLPVWIWNLQNDWLSFSFQLDHGLGAPSWLPTWTVSYVLAQLGLIFPTVVYFALSPRAPGFLHLFAWGPVLFFLLTSFRGSVEANWPLPAYPLILALASTSQRPTKNLWLKVTLGFWGLVLSGLLLVLSTSMMTLPLKSNRIQELRMGPILAQELKQREPLYARNYQIASLLSFQLDRPVYKLRGMSRRDFFDSRPESRPNLQSVFFLVAEAADALPPEFSHLRKDKVQDLDFGLELWEVHP